MRDHIISVAMRAAIPLVLAALMPVRPAVAADTAASYSATWAGLPAAGIRLGFRRDGTAIESEIEIATLGLARWITKFRATAVTDMHVAGDGAAVPSRYQALYDLRKKRGSRVDMLFIAKDGGTTAERGAGDTTQKPQLAEKFRRNVVDPLAALSVIRQALEGHRGETREFTIPVYDDARRFDVVADVVSWNAEDGLVQVKLNLRPIAGFKGESSDDPDPDSAPRPVDVAFTNDAALLPVSLRVSIAFLPLRVTLDHVCKSFSDCAGGAQ